MQDGSDYGVSWSDFPPLLDIDEWVDNEMGKSERDSYFNCYAGCSCIADVKYEVDKWILNKREQLDQLEEMFDNLMKQLKNNDADLADHFWIIEEKVKKLE